MARVDIPTLQCDRCKYQTQDMREMSTFHTLTEYHASGKNEWDLCPTCWQAFKAGFEEDDAG